jgi:HlyD family secretion protein
MSANANFIVKEVKDALLVPDAAFDFRPTPEQIAEGASPRGPRPSRDEMEEDEPAVRPALVWRKVDDKTVAPVRVIKGDSDGTRTIVTLPEGEELKPGDELVTGVSVVRGDMKAGAPGAQKGLFGMNGPQRRQRGTGGVAAKPGQAPQGGGRPGPPM